MRTASEIIRDGHREALQSLLIYLGTIRTIEHIANTFLRVGKRRENFNLKNEEKKDAKDRKRRGVKGQEIKS